MKRQEVFMSRQPRLREPGESLLKDLIYNRRWALLLIFILTAAVYINSIGNSFHYDDEYYIKDNFYIRDIANIPSAFLNVDYLAVGAIVGHYRPLLFASFALNYSINGVSPAGYRLVNLLFHIGSALMVYLIIQTLLTGLKSSLPWISFMAALIFAVHPFNSEVVNYITARSSVMSGFFYLLAFYFWVVYRKVADRRLPALFYIASLVAFLTGMLIKETVITLPLTLFVYDLYFLRLDRSGNQRGNEKGASHFFIKWIVPYLPFLLVIGSAYFAARFFFWRSFIPPFKRDLATQFYTEMPVLAKYIRLLIFPAGLNVDHYVEIYHRPAIPVVLSILFLIIIVAVAAWCYRSKGIEGRLVSFFMAWFFILLSPTTIMPLNAILQENRGYLAGIGIIIPASVALCKISTLDFLRRSISGRAQLLPVAGLSLLVLLLSAATVHRNTVWRDELSLWRDAGSKSPLSAVSHHNLAYAFEKQGKIRSAIREYEKAIVLDSVYARSYYNLGRLYSGQGLTERALDVYEEAVRINPDYYKAYNNLGTLYAEMGRYDQAIEALRKAIDINPGYTMARMNLGKLYEKVGRMDLAMAEFEEVIRITRANTVEAKEALEAARHIEWIKSRI